MWLGRGEGFWLPHIGSKQVRGSKKGRIYTVVITWLGKEREWLRWAKGGLHYWTYVACNLHKWLTKSLSKCRWCQLFYLPCSVFNSVSIQGFCLVSLLLPCLSSKRLWRMRMRRAFAQVEPILLCRSRHYVTDSTFAFRTHVALSCWVETDVHGCSLSTHFVFPDF